MTKTTKAPVMSVAEIADYTGRSPQMVIHLAKDDGFPTPIADLSCGRIWDRDDIVEWFKSMKGKR